MSFMMTSLELVSAKQGDIQMKKIFLILALGFGITQAQALQCNELLKASDSPSDTSLSSDYADAIKILKELGEESEVMTALSDKVEPLLEELALNKKLRAAKGGFSNTLDAKRAAEISKLRSALVSGDMGRVWEVVDETMLRTEYLAVLIHEQRLQMGWLDNALHAGWLKNGLLKYPIRKAKLWAQRLTLKKNLLKLHENYTLYRAFRTTFENQIENGLSEKERAFATTVFSKTGLSNTALSAKLPESSRLEGETRPSIDFIRAEYLGLDYIGGAPRALGGKGLYYRLKIENKALKRIRFRSWFKLTVVHKAVDLVAQAVRKYSSTKYTKALAHSLDWIVRDLQNEEALTQHLAEIETINKISPLSQLKRFEVVRANFKNSSLFSDKEFSFLTSFARSLEYRSLWQKLHLTLALRNTGKTHLLDDLQKARRADDLKSAELNLVQETTKDRAWDADQGTTLEEALIRQREQTREKVDKLLAAINAEVSAFLKLNPDDFSVGTHPGLKSDLKLYQMMAKASERADSMGPLSYEYSPGTNAKLTAYSVLTFAAGRYAIINTPAIDYIDQFLMKTVGFKVPEMDALFALFEPISTAVQPYIDSFTSSPL